MPVGEVFLPFPMESRAAVPPTTLVKGVWIASSLRAVRMHGRMDQYMDLLAPEYRDSIENNVTGDWHPIDLLMAHYEAVEKLDIPALEVVQIGQEATKHAHGVVLGMAARLAGNTVVTPWTIMSQFQRIWDRVYVGGGIGIFKLGPKEARIELVQFPCCRYRYCRTGLRGVLLGLTELFCQKVYVSEIASFVTSTESAMRLAWV